MAVVAEAHNSADGATRELYRRSGRNAKRRPGSRRPPPRCANSHAKKNQPEGWFLVCAGRALEGATG